MSLRRSRIKGITNIPQRKKVNEQPVHPDGDIKNKSPLHSEKLNDILSLKTGDDNTTLSNKSIDKDDLETCNKTLPSNLLNDTSQNVLLKECESKDLLLSTKSDLQNNIDNSSQSDSLNNELQRTEESVPRKNSIIILKNEVLNIDRTLVALKDPCATASQEKSFTENAVSNKNEGTDTNTALNASNTVKQRRRTIKPGISRIGRRLVTNRLQKEKTEETDIAQNEELSKNTEEEVIEDDLGLTEKSKLIDSDKQKNDEKNSASVYAVRDLEEILIESKLNACDNAKDEIAINENREIKNNSESEVVEIRNEPIKNDDQTSTENTKHGPITLKAEEILEEVFINDRKIESSRFISPKLSIGAGENNRVSEVLYADSCRKRLSSLSDGDYYPPASPNKLNRQRIKATPRLGVRQSSCSASESEDESRKGSSTRSRNNSVSSSVSGVQDFIPQETSKHPKDLPLGVQRKCRRTDQSYKLAEARREFHRKFGNNKPDRKRLTMIDLIFYNPASNTLSKDAEAKNDIPAEPATEGVRIEELADDPEDKKSESSDDENEVPAPQIKIGANGEIIIDEKSLVIENKQVKRTRAEMEKSALVDGSKDTGYGIYSRLKRSKDWSKMETLRFYKALNVIGTDFTLMNDLFPKRTRRELRQKFKKEDRTNAPLIDRALKDPCNYDYAMLKAEMEIEERELAAFQAQKAAKPKGLSRTRGRKISHIAKEIAAESGPPPPPPKRPRILKRGRPLLREDEKASARKILNLDRVTSTEDVDADVSDEESSNYVPTLRPTRSGRLPKLKKAFDPSPGAIVRYNPAQVNETSQELSTSKIPEPGTLMVLSSKNPQGNPVYQVFMVTNPKDTSSNSVNIIENTEVDSTIITNKIVPTSQSVPIEMTTLEGAIKAFNFTIKESPDSTDLSTERNSGNEFRSNQSEERNIVIDESLNAEVTK